MVHHAHVPTKPADAHSLLSLSFSARLGGAARRLVALGAWRRRQELARPRFLRVLAAVMDRLDEHAASSGLRLLNPADRVQVAAAAGLGHALAHVAALFAGLVPFAAGGATAYTAKCAAVDLFTASAWLCLAWTVIHTAAMVVAAAGLRSKKAAQRWMAPLAHTLGVAASCISLVDGGCLVAIALQLLIAAAVAAHALLVAARAAQSGARFV